MDISDSPQEDYGFFIDTDEDYSNSQSMTEFQPPVEKSLLRSCSSDGDDSRFTRRRGSMGSDACTTVAADSESSFSSNLCPSASESSLGSLALTTAGDSSFDYKIHCLVEDEQAPVNCRTFPDGTVARIAISGFRLIEDASGEMAEYRVDMIVGSTQRSFWRRFEDFEELTNASLQLACELNRSSPEHKTHPLLLRYTRKTWARVQEQHPLTQQYHCTLSIVKETSYLKILLKHLLFEAPSLGPLLAFSRA